MMSEIKKYIQSILALVYSKDDLEEILFDLSLFNDRIGYHTVVKGGDGDELDKRRTLVASQLVNIESTILKDYFTALLDKNDLWLFDPGHFKMFMDEMNQTAAKTIFFNLTAAVDLKPEDLRELSDKLSAKMEQKVVVHLVVDKRILGGAIIRKDNYIFDYSLKTKLNNLGSQWKKSIQKAG